MPFYDLRGADFHEVFRWLFAMRGDPWVWRLHARRLVKSADVLFDLQERETSLGSWFPACLLAGAALEAYLKGLIVKREGLTFEHRLPKGFKTPKRGLPPWPSRPRLRRGAERGARGPICGRQGSRRYYVSLVTASAPPPKRIWATVAPSSRSSNSDPVRMAVPLAASTTAALRKNPVLR